VVIRAIVTSVSLATASVTNNVTIKAGYYKTLKNINKTKKPAILITYGLYWSLLDVIVLTFGGGGGN